MSIVWVHPQRAQDLITKYDSTSTDVRNGVASLSPLLAEAHALLDQAGQHPLYGPMPALTTVANDLAEDGRDLNWRLDLILEGDGTPMGMSGTIRFETNPMADDPNVTITDALIATGLTPAQAQSAKRAIAAGADFNEAVDQEKQREFDENMANFRRLEAQAWTTTERTPVEQAQHSLDEIRLVLDTAREDKDDGNGIGQGGQVDGVWSTNDLKAIIENKHGYYTEAQIEHARTVLAMAESSPEARDYLGITQSDEGWTFTDIAHLTLDIVGMFPVVGNAADGINAAWYAAEGDYLNAALSSIGMIPVIGQAAIAAKPAIIAASAGIVFKSLDEALAWAKRWLDEAGILKGADEAGSARSADGFGESGQLQRQGDRVVVTQTGPTCGPNSCAMALDTLGYNIDNLDDFIQNFRVEDWGTTPGRMVDDLKRLGIDARAHENLGIDDLASVTSHGDPLLVRVLHPDPNGAGHFVIVDGVTRRNGRDVVAVRDPHGRQYFEDVEVFNERFSGHALTFEG